MDTDWNCKTKWENKRVDALKCIIKRVYALGGGWTMIEIAKGVQNTRVDVLMGGWTLIGIAPKNCTHKIVYALKDGWTITGIAQKSAKIRGIMH